MTLLIVFTCKDGDEWNVTQSFNKISLTILSITVCKCEMGYPCRLFPLLCGHILVPWLSSSSGSVVTLDTCLMKWGYKATLLLAVRVPLWLDGSTPCQGRRCQSIEKPDMEGYLPMTPPILVFQTMTQFHEQLCWSLGPLSDGVSRQWHHSLSQTYVIWQMFTFTTHYPKSLPIISGCSGGCPW